MKGNREINVVDQTSAKDGSNESNVDTKQVVCWKLMVQGWWLIIWIWIAEVRIMSNSYRRIKAHMLLMLILSIQLSTIIIHKQLLIIRSMLMIDWISLLEVQIWKTHLYTLRAKAGGLVRKMISQGLNSLIKTFISSVKNLWNETPFRFQ